MDGVRFSQKEVKTGGLVRKRSDIEDLWQEQFERRIKKMKLKKK